MKILVVDDNADTADMLQMLLELPGHEVRTAYTGGDAMAVAKTFKPELAFVDIHLPDTSGFAVAASLRKLLARGVHIVAITGDPTRRLSLSGQFDEHASKPVTASRLYQAIDSARETVRHARA